jgi:hypothetical protein
MGSVGDLELSVIDTELTEARPAVHRADWVAVLRSRDGRARAVLVLEVQTARRSEKPKAWLLYIAHLAARFRVPVSLVVLTFDERVARWARRSRSFGPGVVFSPIVIGPSDLPEIRTAQQALAAGDAGVVVALARLAAGPSGLAAHTEEIARIFEATLRTKDPARRRDYLSLMHGAAAAPLRAMLERLLEDHGMNALEIIYRDGRAEGRAEGKAEGKAEGEALALLRVLHARNISVDSTSEARILETRDTALLERWLDRAVKASTVEDVLR